MSAPHLTPKPMSTSDDDRAHIPTSGAETVIRAIFVIAMILTVLGGILVVIGQTVGLLAGSGNVVVFFGTVPAKVAFFSATVVCLTSLALHYFPGAPPDTSDE